MAEIAVWYFLAAQGRSLYVEVGDSDALIPRFLNAGTAVRPYAVQHPDESWNEWNVEPLVIIELAERAAAEEQAEEDRLRPPGAPIVNVKAPFDPRRTAPWYGTRPPAWLGWHREPPPRHDDDDPVGS